MEAIDLGTFAPACFKGKDQFEHFSNPDQPSCFACNSAMLMVNPVGVCPDGYVAPATIRLDNGDFVVMPGCYLLFPRLHVTSFDEQPDNWTAVQKWARRTIGLEPPFNLTNNWGKQAGQTAAHAHDWLIDRTTWPETNLTVNTGLATIIFRAARYQITLPYAA